MAPEIGDPRSNMTELIRLYQSGKKRVKVKEICSLKGERSPLCFFFTPSLSSTVWVRALYLYLTTPVFKNPLTRIRI
jgi:hypothetical protein